jgi:hypothetical protein
MSFATEKGIQKARKLVESVIRDRGNNPDQNRVSATEGGVAWALPFGSAAVMIAINSGKCEDQAGRLRIVSPIVKIDENHKLELFERLLRLNGTTLPGVAFGLIENEVVMVIERSVSGLDRGDVDEMIAMIGHYSDKYDDLLALEFGGTRVCDLD